MVVEICKDEMIVYYRFSEEEKADKKFQASLYDEQIGWLDKGYVVCDFLSDGKRYTKDMREMLIRKTISILAIRESKNKSRGMVVSMNRMYRFHALCEDQNG